jgi:3-oxoacyl-[acyl-carrier-protein] synthase-3
MTNFDSVGLRSLTVRMPEAVRTNDYYRTRYPDTVRDASSRTLGRVLAVGDAGPSTTFERAMVPYLDDPFRGVVERRALGPTESSIDLEVAAGREALELAGLRPDEVDLLISVSFVPDHVGIGNAVYVADRLGLTGSAWNLETACAGALTAMQTACALVRAQEHRHVLVTVSCSYTRHAPEEDTLSWFLGDGAGAFVVGPVAAGTGYLGAYTMHTADTCGMWGYELELSPETGSPQIAMRARPRTGHLMRETVEPHLVRTCTTAAERAGLRLDDIDFFVFHTPVAWFASFAAAALGIDPERTASVHHHFANMGPALTPTNLHFAAASGRIRHGDTVLVYGPGSSASNAAVVLRWGDVALGRTPPGVVY